MRIAIALACTLAAAFAGDELERAKKLRDGASADWNAKNYAEAAAKLLAADEIYKSFGDDHAADRAVVQRALAWNLVRAGMVDDARDALYETMKLAKKDENLKGEVTSAYRALYEAADKAGDAEGAKRVLEPVRARAQGMGDSRLAAQVLHDLGYLAANRGESDAALGFYEQAAADRACIDDHEGYVWSLNNAAHVLLEAGRPAEALRQLGPALELLRRHRVVAPQLAIGINLRRACADPSKLKAVQPADWGHLVAASASTDFPRIVPTTLLAITALQATGDEKLARRFATLAVDGAPKAVVADLRIRAAAALGSPELKVETGSGPCLPHLQARASLVRALAIAGAEKAVLGHFLKEANAAVATFVELGDFGGRRDAAGRLLKALNGWDELDADGNAAKQAWSTMLRAGQPGGAGGSASSGGDRSGFKKLGQHAPVFRVSAVGGKLSVEDLVADRLWTYDVTWKPRNVSLNGVALTIFGGYVRIKSFHYGGGAAASGAPGSTTLDELREYWPVGEGSLEILKNGAVQYAE